MNWGPGNSDHGHTEGDDTGCDMVEDYGNLLFIRPALSASPISSSTKVPIGLRDVRNGY